MDTPGGVWNGFKQLGVGFKKYWITSGGGVGRKIKGLKQRGGKGWFRNNKLANK